MIRGFWDWLWVLIRGFFMGSADIIPGISGGTIAFISGLYERLIASLRRPLRGWFLLGTVALGIIIAALSIARALRYLLNTAPDFIYLYAVFFGLIVGSIYMCYRKVGRWSLGSWISLLLGIFGGYFLAASEKGKGEQYEVPYPVPHVENLSDASNYNLATETLTVDGDMLAALQAEELVAPSTIVRSVEQEREDEAQAFVSAQSITGFRPTVLGAGMIAACALLLPGVSGAYLLKVMGFYTDAIANLALLSSGHWEALGYLATLAGGVILGLLLFSHLIGMLLDKFHSLTLALLTGLMIGALRAVWPFWSYQFLLNPIRLGQGLQLDLLYPVWPDVASATFWIAVAWLVGSFVVVFSLERISYGRS